MKMFCHEKDISITNHEYRKCGKIYREHFATKAGKIYEKNELSQCT